MVPEKEILFPNKSPVKSAILVSPGESSIRKLSPKLDSSSEANEPSEKKLVSLFSVT